MAAVEVLQTLEYRGGQLNAAPVLELVKGIQKGQWTRDERKVANLDQRLKILIMSVLPDDQMNFVINCLTAKSTWDDLILYHEGPSNVKENRAMDLKLCYNTFNFKEVSAKVPETQINLKDSDLAISIGKLKYEENLIDSIYETEKNKYLVSATPLSTVFISTSIVQDFQDSPDDEEDIRSSHEYLNDLEEEYQARALFAKSKNFFQEGYFKGSTVKKQLTKLNAINVARKHKPKLRPTKDFEAKYNKVKAKLVLLSSSASTKVRNVKNKGLIAEAYTGLRRSNPSDDNDMVRTLLEMKDNDDRKTYLDYLYIDLNYVEEQRNNLLSKHRDLHVNTEILKENKNLRTELKELTSITETWLNSSNKVNQCTSEQIPSQKNRILRVDQLIEDPSTKSFILPNHDTGRILPAESQRNITNPLVAVTDSSTTEYDSADESSVCSTPLPSYRKMLDEAEPIF
ncbi:hypothetical protein Tco_0807781 [Tanacetum coccineum]